MRIDCSWDAAATELAIRIHDCRRDPYGVCGLPSQAQLPPAPTLPTLVNRQLLQV